MILSWVSVTSGEKQHRGVNAFLADATGDGESIDVRQHDVQHDEVRLHFSITSMASEPEAAVFTSNAGEVQGSDQQFSDGRLVVDNNNRCFNRLTHAS